MGARGNERRRRPGVRRPVARFLGPRAWGALSFALFYLTCGVLAGLGYAALNPHSGAAVVGASGAVSGLFGAASRLIEHRPGLSPFASRTVVGFAAAWLVTNVALGLIGVAPGSARSRSLGRPTWRATPRAWC